MKKILSFILSAAFLLLPLAQTQSATTTDTIVAIGKAAGAVSVWSMNSTTADVSLVRDSIVSNTAHPALTALGDVDNDGVLDVIAYPQNLTATHHLVVQPYTTDSTSYTVEVGSDSTGRGVLGVDLADYNGGGRSEIISAYHHQYDDGGISLDLYTLRNHFTTDSDFRAIFQDKYIWRSADYDDPTVANLSAGQLNDSGATYVAVASDVDSRWVMLYKLQANQKVVLIDTINFRHNPHGLQVAIDSQSQLLYIMLRGRSEIHAYTLSHGQLVYQPNNNVMLSYKPRAITAANGTLAVVRNDQSAVDFYQTGTLIQTIESDSSVASVAMKSVNR